jgi:hypothetical protein
MLSSLSERRIGLTSSPLRYNTCPIPRNNVSISDFAMGAPYIPQGSTLGLRDPYRYDDGPARPTC